MYFSLAAGFVINCVNYLRHTKHFAYAHNYILHTQLLLKQITEYQFSGNEEMLDPQRYLKHYST